jgi:hypothetical protein
MPFIAISSSAGPEAARQLLAALGLGGVRATKLDLHIDMGSVPTVSITMIPDRSQFAAMAEVLRHRYELVPIDPPPIPAPES